MLTEPSNQVNSIRESCCIRPEHQQTLCTHSAIMAHWHSHNILAQDKRKSCTLLAACAAAHLCWIQYLRLLDYCNTQKHCILTYKIELTAQRLSESLLCSGDPVIPMKVNHTKEDGLTLMPQTSFLARKCLHFLLFFPYFLLNQNSA
jgi:hypothetical protein